MLKLSFLIVTNDAITSDSYINNLHETFGVAVNIVSRKQFDSNAVHALAKCYSFVVCKDYYQEYANIKNMLFSTPNTKQTGSDAVEIRTIRMFLSDIHVR